MKKLIGIATAVCMAVFVSGCGNSWEIDKKNMKSDWSELRRSVRVYDSRTKETLFEYSGFVYISDSSKPGDITIIYRKDGVLKKNDYIGENMSIVAEEL